MLLNNKQLQTSQFQSHTTCGYPESQIKSSIQLSDQIPVRVEYLICV